MAAAFSFTDLFLTSSGLITYNSPFSSKLYRKLNNYDFKFGYLLE